MRLFPCLLLLTLACKPTPTPTQTKTDGRSDLLAAYQNQRSKVWMEVEGTVTKLLPDDTKGDQHQRFIVDVRGHTVLVAHNIDLAERVPVQPNTRVRIRGRYEYNDKGGVLHWTHADPKNRQRGGWIRITGERAPRER